MVRVLTAVRNAAAVLIRKLGRPRDALKAKRSGELRYWEKRAAAEGSLVSDHYEWAFTEHFGLTRSEFTNKCLLDIGCGPRGSWEWADMARERIGLDPLAHQYRGLGTGRHAMWYVAASSDALPFRAEHCDIMASFNSLDHVDNLDMTVREVVRVLKRGGLFLLLAEVNQKPTIVEPITLTWDIASSFVPHFKVLHVRHFEMLESGMYGSLRTARPFDHSNLVDRSGILSALFTKV